MEKVHTINPECIAWRCDEADLTIELLSHEMGITPASQQDQPDPTDHIPDCPRCGKPMVLRTAKQGKNAGRSFWECSGYPDCKGVESL
ncbi:MAG: topoisomerase DNA-binding C4 zinc finger domain-containing protein [Candidatus Hydrogenedentes bacterium]|nr:topoisomerase DNA-binding C4 zinc finger domain-containing protein [Candidatus Hydrogenedentota bacterium]